MDRAAKARCTFARLQGGRQTLQINGAIVIRVYSTKGHKTGEPFAHANFLEPYLRFLLAFRGIEPLNVVTTQGTTSALDALEGNMEAARA